MRMLQSKLIEQLREPPVMLDEELRRALLEALLFPPRSREMMGNMTYEEFLDWADEDTLAEWVASPGKETGEVVMYSPASRQHQEISFFLGQVIGIYVEQRQLGEVLLPPFQMKLAQSGREPDLIFVAQEHLDRLKETYLDGPADLAVEILSPESAKRDRGEKFYEYEKASIPEYWLIDPLREQVEFYRLDARGLYQLIPPNTEGVYRSSVLRDFWLRVEWLWQPPQVLNVLQELDLI